MDPSSAPWRVVDAPPPQAGSGGPAPSPAVTPSRGALVGAAGLVAVLTAAAVAIAGGWLPGGEVVGTGDGVGAASGGSVVVEAAGPDGPAGEIVVDVTGAVVAPGVYRLPGGSRVGDALRAAGGFGPRVDPVRAARELNLAAQLADGEQVVVPSRDDPAAAALPVDASAAAGSGGGSGGDPGDGLVDLNRATGAELEALPGIGPVTAAKIIDSREAAPFASVDDLRTRKLLGQKAFEGLRDLVRVR